MLETVGEYGLLVLGKVECVRVAGKKKSDVDVDRVQVLHVAESVELREVRQPLLIRPLEDLKIGRVLRDRAAKTRHIV